MMYVFSLALRQYLHAYVFVCLAGSLSLDSLHVSAVSVTTIPSI